MYLFSCLLSICYTCPKQEWKALRGGACPVHHPLSRTEAPNSSLYSRPAHDSLASCNMRMAQTEDKAPEVPTEGVRLVPPQVNKADRTPLGVLSTLEPLIRLQRTWGVWHVPELDTQDAEALVGLWPLGSFLVTGRDPSQVLVLRTGPLPGEVNTYQIQKIPRGVSLESSNLCMPDLPHLLAFLSASRDVLPRTLLLPPPTLGPRDEHTDPLQIGRVQQDTPGKVLSIVNQLYLETHRGWGREQTPQETEPEAAQRHDPAPRNPAPHGVSWVKGPLSPEVAHPGPALTSLLEEEEEDLEGKEEGREDDPEEEGPEDVLTIHVQSLVRARSSYVARQYRSLRVRIASDSGGPHGSGDPATELLQDVRHLLTDLQDHLAKDSYIRAVFGSRGPGVPKKGEDPGNGRTGREPPRVQVCNFVLSIGAHTFPSAPTRPSYISHAFYRPRVRASSHPGSLFHTCSHPCLHSRGTRARQEWLWARVGCWSAWVGVGQLGGPVLTRPPPPAGPALETAVCQAVLAPLKPALWTRLRTLRAPELRRLRRRQTALRAGAGPPGAQGPVPEGQSPAPALRSRIHERLTHLHAACAPRRKVALLLEVCRDVYAGLAQGENQEPLGADAFLPALTEELIWSPDIGETQLDVEFLMELLDPDELRGEAGYYLTTWFGALHHIAHYQPETDRAPRGLSSEARASLHQWHRRRTLHRKDHPRAQANLPFKEPWAEETVPGTSDS
nr:ras and Rab interactor-like protein isoform X3 [Symphalangus syndactylus]